MRIKTAELTDNALNWAVTKCKGVDLLVYRRDNELVYIADDGIPYGSLRRYSTDWRHGGPIIEEQEIAIQTWTAYDFKEWRASLQSNKASGPTPLIAAMRCYVTSMLGSEVEVPDELVR